LKGFLHDLNRFKCDETCAFLHFFLEAYATPRRHPQAFVQLTLSQRNPKIQLKCTFVLNNSFSFLSANGFGQYVQAFADGGWDDVEDVLDQWPRVVPPFPCVL